MLPLSFLSPPCSFYPFLPSHQLTLVCFSANLSFLPFSSHTLSACTEVYRLLQRRSPQQGPHQQGWAHVTDTSTDLSAKFFWLSWTCSYIIMRLLTVPFECCFKQTTSTRHVPRWSNLSPALQIHTAPLGLAGCLCMCVIPWPPGVAEWRQSY